MYNKHTELVFGLACLPTFSACWHHDQKLNITYNPILLASAVAKWLLTAAEHSVGGHFVRAVATGGNG